MELPALPTLRAPDRSEFAQDGRTLNRIWEAKDGTGRIVEVATSHSKSSGGFRSSILPAVQTSQEYPTDTPGLVSVVRSTAYSVSLMDAIYFSSTPAPRFSRKALLGAADAALAALPSVLATNRCASEWFTVIEPVPTDT